MNFRDSLVKGNAMEVTVLNLLKEKGMNLIHNPNDREMDLLIVENGIEVKCDEKAQITGNFYIEVGCNGKPSGLFKQETVNLKYWAHSDGHNVYIIEGEKLKEWVKEKIENCNKNKSQTSKGMKFIEAGGDGGRSKGLVVPVSSIKDISEFVMEIKEN